ncbi:MAG: hypothetical protein QM766_27545 [Burkholderiaceae bacterium]
MTSEIITDLWCVGRDTVYAGPMEPMADVIRRFGPSVRPARQCRICIHLHRPGLSDGYCGRREDLPPAYGVTHRLRHLPPDLGANCGEWSAQP